MSQRAGGRRAWQGAGRVDSRAELEQYIITPYLRPATGLPEDELVRLARAAADRLPSLAIDDVRLDIDARRGS